MSHGSNKSTELNQRMPIAAVARETRRFDCEHRTDAALANRGKQALETGAAYTISGSTHVFVNYLNIHPTKLVRAINETVLPSLAFQIVYKLPWR